MASVAFVLSAAGVRSSRLGARSVVPLGRVCRRPRGVVGAPPDWPSPYAPPSLPLTISPRCMATDATATDSTAAAASASPFVAKAPSVDGAAAADATAGERPPPRKLRVVSGVQPTGSLHLGNYLGAIAQWTSAQDAYDSRFCIVDLHAITVPHDAKKLSAETIDAAATYLACGIDPAKASIFVQSHVRAHTELTWLLNCMTPVGWLERMIQYKEKAVKQGDSVGMGLFGYPVLMAADILLYQADLVPVGEDQRQHLELARDIARRFNDLYRVKRSKGLVMREPQALILDEGARVMALDDGTSKMSKSSPNDGSRINLVDSADVIARKVKRCKTDMGVGLTFSDPSRPECRNLLTIYAAVTGRRSAEEVEAEVGGLRWGEFKPRLTEALIAHLSPIQARHAELSADPAYLYDILRRGADEANEAAEVTLEGVKRRMGFVLPKDLTP
ncbi:hypothetical protein MMPV_005162 [Pyropia vietnamensis]